MILDERQRKLAYKYKEEDFEKDNLICEYIEIDIENKSESCYSIMNNLQRIEIEKPNLCRLDNLFKKEKKNMKNELKEADKKMPILYVQS